MSSLDVDDQPTRVPLRRDKAPFVLLATFGFLIIALIIVRVVFELLPTRTDDLTFEVAKAAMQLVVVVVLGGVVTLSVSAINAQRDQRRARHEWQFSSWGELMAADRDINIVRRTFRAAGLQMTETATEPPLRSEQILVLREGMDSLLKANVAIEHVIRGLNARRLFDASEEIQRNLKQVYAYHKQIAQEWQEKGYRFWPGQEVRASELPQLQGLMSTPRPNFPEEALRTIMRLYREELIEGP